MRSIGADGQTPPAGRVYVDPLMNHGWSLGPSCHMFVTAHQDLELLHAKAAELGLRREWFQDKPRGMPHYDLTRSKRELAVTLGVVPVTLEELVASLRTWRAWKKANDEND